jgi:tRNA(Ile)-lysidine synthase TilS/MesJ
MSSLFARRIQATLSSSGRPRPGDRVLVGASGGADSSALVLVLVELGFTVGLGHLNHGLRGGESDADQRFVQDLAERLNAPFFSRKVAIQDIPGNLEAVGRAERRKFLESVREREVFD